MLRDTSIAKEGTAGTLPDSSAICAFLEKRFPEPAFYPADPFLHGRAIWLEEYCDSELMSVIGMGIFRPIQFARFSGKVPDLATAKATYAEKLPPKLDYLEGEFNGGAYLVGDTPSIADVSAACSITQLNLVAGPLDASRWPALADLVERMTSRPSFQPALQICKKIVKQEPIDLTA